jgi:predicted AlkP superfamily phosphohydrolase/phosphomutase
VPPSEYEALRDELVERLEGVTAPHPLEGKPVRVFPKIVHKTEALYGCGREENPNLPDLMLEPYPGLAVVRKIRGRQEVRWCALGRLEGTHRVEGVLGIGGPNVKSGLRVDANIVDITPTALAALGLRVPVDMEGRVIEEAFEPKPIIETEPPVAHEREAAVEAYS